MEKWSRGLSCRAAICGIVVLLSATAFSCSLAAEFRKVKEKDMKLDGSLCSLPKSSAFELGVAAIAFLSVAQLVGTTAAATTMCTASKHSKSSTTTRRRGASVAILVLSWVSFAMAVVLLATAASMNHGQRYGRGWMDGDCYVARNGVFGGAAALVVVTALLILGLTSAAKSSSCATAAAAACPATTTIRLDAATDAEQPGGRSKQ
ncbi:hypothetical protein E2562_034274 [Oryza meyeriana var. granulata]|uniref:Uncharacterized protein n=1 Tax=Oryza meyeriana var. granulata TaxID=110450 RepID=A0A6G1FEY9_9ORYZ|nr:hypothetical protein E2562_034274 [Oryza meyeriana var. granulata]